MRDGKYEIILECLNKNNYKLTVTFYHFLSSIAPETLALWDKLLSINKGEDRDILILVHTEPLSSFGVKYNFLYLS